MRRLNEDVEIQRLDALRKLHYLELMTPQLLSAFLPSLSDQHASIRTEAIAVTLSLSSVCERERKRYVVVLYPRFVVS